MLLAYDYTHTHRKIKNFENCYYKYQYNII